MRSIIHRLLAVLLLASPLSAAGAPARAPLRVLAAGATQSTLRGVVGEFEKQTGLHLQLTYGGVGKLRDRVVAGEPADVLIVTPAIIEQMQEKKLVLPDSRVDLGQVGGGIAVRVGAPRPAVGSPDELRRALLDAEEIYCTDPATTTSGAYLLSVADRLGIGAAVRKKAHTAPDGKVAMQRLARSHARAIGVTQESEILAVKGVVLVGPYPAPLQKTTIYSGVVVSAASQPDGARAFLRFLVSPPVQARFRKAGFEAAEGPPAR